MLIVAGTDLSSRDLQLHGPMAAPEVARLRTALLDIRTASSSAVTASFLPDLHICAGITEHIKVQLAPEMADAYRQLLIHWPGSPADWGNSPA